MKKGPNQKELAVMAEVLELLEDDKLDSNQMDKLLWIMSAQLAERTPDLELKKELLAQTEQLVIQVKINETQKLEKALINLRENFNDNKKIKKDTLPNIDIVMNSDIEFSEPEHEFIKWLENIMAIRKGASSYKIVSVEPEEEIEIKENFVSISERVKAEGTKHSWEMDNSSLEPVLLRAVAQKGLINSYSLANIEQELKDKDITAVLKETIDKKYWNTIDDLVSQINKRYQTSIKRQRELY